MLDHTKVVLLAVGLSFLATTAACADDPTGGEAGSSQKSDPTATSVGDPHGAIRAMSKASEPGGKPDHAKTKIPDAVIPGGSSGSGK